MTTIATTATATQAQEFFTTHHGYFFEDAHFQVEAAASSVAEEISHNVFEFKDASILRIGAMPAVQVFKGRAELNAFLSPTGSVPLGQHALAGYRPHA